MNEAHLARDAGQIFNPAGSNAIELYAAAVAADPSNAIVAAELDAVIERALGMAEAALLEARVDDAEAALQRVSLVDANNGRLPFLSAQLWQMQLRNHLADARAAVRDRRFEDAGNAIAAAIALNVGDTSEIEAVRTELSEARSNQQVDDVLVKANTRFEEGSLLNPPNDNARYYYELVLSNDPTNTAARQGLNAVASKFALQARAEIDAGNLDSAAALLDEASAIDASSTELAATATALAGAWDAIAERERLAVEERRRIEAANRQAAADEAAAAERQQAEEAALEAAAIESTDNAVDAGNVNAEAAADASETTFEPVTEDVAEDAADEVPAETVAEEQASKPEPVVAAEQEPVVASESETIPVAEQTPVSVSSLTRTRYSAPKYPRAAQRRSQSGWVDVIFTVAMDGSVKDVEVRDSEPEELFSNAALSAVEKWEFEPVLEDGVLVEKRAGVRMLFAFEN